MAYKNRFYKTTLGYDAEVLVTKAVEYSDDTDIKSFVANAVEGEVAVFNAATGAILTSAAAVGTEVFIGLKRDGNLERTSSFVIEAGMLTKIAYVAPVKQVTTITTTGAPAVLVKQELTYTAKESGTAGNLISVAYTAGATAGAEVVTVTGNAISVQIETGVSTGTQVMAAINGDASAAALVSVRASGTASNAQETDAADLLTGGVDQPEITKGDYAEVAVIETTPGMEPFPRWSYGVTANEGETFQELIVRLVAKINDATNIENQNKTLIVTAAVAGTSGESRDNFTLTSVDFGTHFTVALRGILVDYASAAVTTVFKVGSGTPEQAKIAEQAGDVRRGYGTEYADQNATAADFGYPTSFADANGSSAQYVVYSIKYIAKDQARTLEQLTRKNHIAVYVHDSTADPISEFDTIFTNAD